MDTTNESESDGEWRRSVSAPPVIEETESVPPPSEETEPVVNESQAPPPPNQLKIDALRRLKALERRGKTVGTHLDELRGLLTVLFELLLPD